MGANPEEFSLMEEKVRPDGMMADRPLGVTTSG
jgi:hypothetical protein